MEDISSDGLSSRQGNRLHLSGDIVTIKCGDKSFQVHKELLCDHSPYFKNLFKGGFKEADENVTELDDTTELVCGDFLQWLYVEAAAKRRGTSFIGSIGFSGNLRLHIFADRYDIPLLRDATLRSIHRLIYRGRKFPHYDTVTEASKIFPETSAIMRLFVDAYAQFFRVDELQGVDVERIQSGLPQGFITAFVRKAKIDKPLGRWSPNEYDPPVEDYLGGKDPMDLAEAKKRAKPTYNCKCPTPVRILPTTIANSESPSALEIGAEWTLHGWVTPIQY